MCGIFAYVGKKNSLDIAVEGLKRLEYRGYDSSGIAGLSGDILKLHKQAGKISSLEEELKDKDWDLDLVIGHTRWATHGKPNHLNAHPHMDQNKQLAVVHNGIIENYESLKKMLQLEGISFQSETDSEVVAQLIAYYYKGDLHQTLQKVLAKLQGAFALALIHKDYPGTIFATTKESPLIVGIGNGESFIASDTQAFLVHTRDVCYLKEGELVMIKANDVQFFDETATQVIKQTQEVDKELEKFSKGYYEHFMLKEIFEQPQVIKNALLSRYKEEEGTACLDALGLSQEELLQISRILILGCGTSYHAGCIAAYTLEDKAIIPVQVEISSEFRYKNPIIQADTLVIAISQSGETADTIAAVREVRAKGAKVLAICNVQGSTLAREADFCILLRAGMEVSVCSTKAFTSQLVVLSLFSLLLSRMRYMSQSDGISFIKALKELPDQVQKVLDNGEHIESIANKYARFDHYFFIGRQHMYPASLEAALKIKEIAYVNANGYPAGEMKHGPIALINSQCLTIAMCGNELTFSKLLSNIMEIKARGGPVVAIMPLGVMHSKDIEQIADDVIWVPSTLDELASIPFSVVGQLFAYYIARQRGTDIDHPRNLAKSVTVE